VSIYQITPIFPVPNMGRELCFVDQAKYILFYFLSTILPPMHPPLPFSVLIPSQTPNKTRSLDNEYGTWLDPHLVGVKVTVQNVLIVCCLSILLVAARYGWVSLWLGCTDLESFFFGFRWCVNGILVGAGFPLDSCFLFLFLFLLDSQYHFGKRTFFPLPSTL